MIKGLELCPMTLFNPVFNCQTRKGIKRLRTQADEGLTLADEAGSVVLRQPPDSKLANLFRIDVRTRLSASSRSSLAVAQEKHPPGGSLLKQHPAATAWPGNAAVRLERDFMLEVLTGATI